MAQRGRPKKTIQKPQPAPKAYFDQIKTEVETNQSKLSMVLGGLIILVIGILIFNYFNKSNPSLGPSSQTEQSPSPETGDVSPNQLPGKYTVKEDDTLFIIAEKYYQDGSRFEDIAKANNIIDVDLVETGTVLEIPKLEEATPTPGPSESPTESPAPSSPLIEQP